MGDVCYKQLIREHSAAGLAIERDRLCTSRSPNILRLVLTRYKESVVMSQRLGVADGLLYPDAMVQWVGDRPNVHHNLQTVDGQRTFHGMGRPIIAVICTVTRGNLHSVNISL